MRRWALAPLAVALALVSHAEPARAPHRLVFVGDILLGADGAATLARHPPAWPFARVRELVAHADTLVGNAEGPLTHRERRPGDERRWNYAAAPPVARLLAELGFDAVGLANNHALDRGAEGLADSLWHLDQAGVGAFGAGADLAAAREPHWVDTPSGRVAIVALGEDESARWRLAAGAQRAGIFALTEEHAVRAAQHARASGAALLVAYVHWGENYQGVVRSQREAARMLARAGYDLVVGHHPHVVQDVERIGSTWVFYSLGNFVFTTTGRFRDRESGRGLVLTAALGAQGIERFELACLVTDSRVVRYQPRPCSSGEARRLWRRLGDPIEPRGDRGVVDARPRAAKAHTHA